MIKKSLIMLKISLLFAVSLSFLINTPVVSAQAKLGAGERCGPNSPSPGIPCIDGSECMFDQPSGFDLCLPSPFASTFGKIQPPAPLAGFLAKDPTGAGALSQFFSNFVALIFSLAGVVLIFMILWGAFEWMTSEGDKEKLGTAQKRILNALIGLLIFAAAFAIIRVFGQFTGFQLFRGQAAPYYCYSGATLNLSKNPPVCVSNFDSRETPPIICSNDQVFDAGKGECRSR